MTFEHLLTLIQSGESEQLEFKLSTGSLKASLETVCALLNQKGGHVIFGITDQSQLVGQQVSDNTRKEIARELARIEPPAQIQVDYLLLTQNKYVIVFTVLEGTYKPYRYDGRCFQRDQSTTRRMSVQRQNELVIKHGQFQYAWERLPAPHITMEDLDQDLILGLVHKAVEAKRMPGSALRQTVPQLLESLHLYEQGQLTNAAVVLFAKHIKTDFLQCQLKLARFKGTTRHEFIDSDVVYGNFFELLEKGSLFIKRHLPVAARIISGQWEREETPLIPFPAIREALINALAHRDYSALSGSVGLAIYDDRMELFNDGSLPPAVTFDKIKAGYSKPRNPLIADVLHRCHLIERWGRGIHDMITFCLKAGDPEPEFTIDAVEFKVCFRFPTSLKPVVESPSASIVSPHELSPRQYEIIQILKKAQVLKADDIRQQLTVPLADRTLRKDLSQLKALKLIDSTGHARTTRWFLIKPTEDNGL